MAVMNVAELSVPELKTLIREVVTQTISDLLNDPDTGLELRDEFKLLVQQSVKSVQVGGKTTSAKNVAQRLSLEW